MTIPDAGISVIFAHGAAPSAEFWIEALLILLTIAVLGAIVWGGIVKRRRWPWRLALTAIVSITFFVVSTYQFEVRDAVVLPLLDLFGL